MAKSRMIARTISIDKELNELSIKSQLIYTWCIPFLDDYGLITNDIGNIKYLVFPRNKNVTEGDITVFASEARNLIEELVDCYHFKGFEKNNIITEYKKTRSEFRENLYNKGKSKYSPEFPQNPPKNSSKVRIGKVRIGKVSLINCEPSPPDEESCHINDLMKILYEINPTLNFGNKTQRKSALNLIKKLGLEKALESARASIAIHGKPYAPTITTPMQLENKLSELMAFYKKNNTSTIVDISNL